MPLTTPGFRPHAAASNAGSSWPLDIHPRSPPLCPELSSEYFFAASSKCARRSLFIVASSGFPDRKSTRLNSSHANISYAVFCLKKKIHASQDLRARVDNELRFARLRLANRPADEIGL